MMGVLVVLVTAMVSDWLLEWRRWRRAEPRPAMAPHPVPRALIFSGRVMRETASATRASIDSLRTAFVCVFVCLFAYTHVCVRCFLLLLAMVLPLRPVHRQHVSRADTLI